MKKALAILALAVGSTVAFAQANHVRIDNPYARATAPGAAVGGGYATLRNTGKAPDRLVGASSAASARTELHEMKMVDNVMRMREVAGIDVPAGGSVELKPGGYHLMFMELKAQLKQGDKVPVTLKFEKAGEVTVQFEVRGMAAGSGRSSHGHGQGHGTGKKH